MATLTKIEGIGEKYSIPLQAMGIRTTEALLKVGASRKGRKEIADATKLSDKRILDWVNRADLFRVKGVGEEYSDLLEAAGVDTVKELSKRVPENLHAAMAKTNEAKKLVRRMPPVKTVENWVAHAKKLPAMITH